jgi:hypothetical protein
MKTFEIIRSKGIINTHKKTIIHQDKTPNSLKVGKDITLGSSGRGLGNRIEILVGDPFPFACKRKSKGGLLWPQQMVTHWKNQLSLSIEI